MILTLQETFDFVANHLYDQGKPAILSHGGIIYCRLRAPDGCKCALGCLIPDDRYEPRMEAETATYLITNWPEIFGSYDKSLITHLQFVHDESYVLVRVKRMTWMAALNVKLARVAKEFGLKFTPR